MNIVDARGRIFGWMNLIDAVLLAFLVALVPIGYGSYLLFRPAQPRIDSVTEVSLNKEELRIASGTAIGAKLKIRGTGFNPLMRARVGDVNALSFVFENPNSADVLIGEMPPGKYDLVLFDGVQEVARAADVVRIQAYDVTTVRLSGRLNVSDELAKSLSPGFKSRADVRGGFEVLALGSPRPSFSHVRFGDRDIEIPAGSTERPVVLRVRCDRLGTDCSIGGITLSQPTPIALKLAGDLAFIADELILDAEPSRARVVVNVEGPQVDLLRVGDRDTFLDDRAAIITALGTRVGNGVRATFSLGADPSSTGWQYRNQSLKPGSTLRVETDRYVGVGTVVSVEMIGSVKK